MKVCIIASQITGFGKIGGFGSMTRKLAESLSQQHIEVVIAVPKRKEQHSIERFEGFTVIGLTPIQLLQRRTYKKINADIYHSQNPNLMTLVAQFAEPSKVHIITCRDPRNLRDWLTEFRYATWQTRLRIPFYYLFEESLLVSWAVRRADVVGCPAHHLKKKITKMHGLKKKTLLLPNLETIPSSIPEKAERPTICFIGRLDKRKRPELFIQLAHHFPHVQFNIIGRSDEKDRQIALEQSAVHLDNITMHGFIDKFASSELYNILNKSWILVNTSIREGLPLTFIEAAGRGCAILSKVNPDHFASQFGFCARNDNFIEGLHYLLEQNRWKDGGQKAFEYVRKIYDDNSAVQYHVALYKKAIQKKRGTLEINVDTEL